MAISTFKKSVAQTLGLPNAANGIVGAKKFTGNAGFAISEPGTYLCDASFSSGTALLNSAAGSVSLTSNSPVAFSSAGNETAQVQLIGEGLGLSESSIRYERNKSSRINASSSIYAMFSLDYFPQTGKWLLSNGGTGCFGDDVDNFGTTFTWSGGANTQWSNSYGKAVYFNGKYWRAHYNYQTLSYVTAAGSGASVNTTYQLAAGANNDDGTEAIFYTNTNSVSPGWKKAKVVGGVETLTDGTSGIIGSSSTRRIAHIIYADGEFLAIGGDTTSGGIYFAKASTVDDLTASPTVVTVAASGFTGNDKHKSRIFKLGSTLIINPYQDYSGTTSTFYWFTSTDGGATWSQHSKSYTSRQGYPNWMPGTIMNNEWVVPVLNVGWFGTTDPTQGTLTFKPNMSSKVQPNHPFYTNVDSYLSLPAGHENYVFDFHYVHYASSDNENFDAVLMGGANYSSTNFSGGHYFQPMGGKMFIQRTVYGMAGHTEPTTNETTGGASYSVNYLELDEATGRLKVLPTLCDPDLISTWSGTYGAGVSKITDTKWYFQQYGSGSVANYGKIWEVNGSIYDVADYSRVALPDNATSESWYNASQAWMLYRVNDTELLIQTNATANAGYRPYGSTTWAGQASLGLSTSDQLKQFFPAMDGYLMHTNTGSVCKLLYVTGSGGSLSYSYWRNTSSGAFGTNISYDEVTDVIWFNYGATTSQSGAMYYPASALKTGGSPTEYNFSFAINNGAVWNNFSAGLGAAIFINENGYVHVTDSIQAALDLELAGTNYTMPSVTSNYVFEETYNYSNGNSAWLAGIWGGWIILGKHSEKIMIIKRPVVSGSAAIYSTVFEEA